MDRPTPPVPTTDAQPQTLEERYLDLMKQALTRLLFPDERYGEVSLKLSGWSWKGLVSRPIRTILRRYNLVLSRKWDPEDRALGRDWPDQGETMIGMARLNNLQACVGEVLEAGVPGDLIETGVWRGGASIFIRRDPRCMGRYGTEGLACRLFSRLAETQRREIPGGQGTRPLVEGRVSRGQRRGSKGELPKICPARRPGSISRRLVSRHSARRADLAAGHLASRRRSLRIDHGCDEDPLPEAVDWWLRDRRRLRHAWVRPSHRGLPSRKLDH